MRLRLALVAAAGVLAFGAAVAFLMRPSQEVSPLAGDAVTATVELRRMLGDQKPLVLPPGPGSEAEEHAWWNGPLAAVFDRLRAGATGGDIAAAHALGSRSMRCMRILRDDTPAALLAELRRDTADDARMAGVLDADQLRIRRENISRQMAQRLSAYEDCAAIGAGRMSEYLHWLERAGRANHGTARLTYIDAVQELYSNDRGALIADIEHIRPRRELARRWLEEAVRNGDETAFHTYSEALKGSWLYPADYVNAMAHAYALELAQSRRTGNFEQRWQDGLRAYGDRLTAAEWAHASRRGREIFMATLRHRPVWEHGPPPPEMLRRLRERKRLPAVPAT